MQDLPIIAYKNLGETPLETLERVRKERNIDPNIPMTYAGRLDPMAEGVLLILFGEECKNKEKYLRLDKMYEFQALVGFSTDTHDLLGIITASSEDKISGPRGKSPDTEILSSDFASALDSFKGTLIQKYPSFSSKTINGKQLFQRALDDELPDEMPEHDVTIYEISCTSTVILKKEELHKEILRRIALVKGDFRQEEVIKRWNEVFENSKEKEFIIFKCVCECSSGTYIRQLVADISEKIRVPLVTYSINRTQVGEYII